MSNFNPLGSIQTPKLVMFDLDGTLVDSVPDLHAGIALMLEELGRDIPSIDQVRNWVGNGAAMLVKRALSNDMTPSDDLEPDLFDSGYQSFVKHYAVVNGKHAVLYDGVDKLFTHLQGRNLHIAIITNKPEQFTLPLLKQLNLSAELVLSGDSLDNKKPHPEPLLHCLEFFGVSSEYALMVGDSKSDIDAARASKVPCIAVSYGYNHGQSVESLKADRIVDSLCELIES